MYDTQLAHCHWESQNCHKHLDSCHHKDKFCSHQYNSNILLEDVKVVAVVINTTVMITIISISHLLLQRMNCPPPPTLPRSSRPSIVLKAPALRDMYREDVLSWPTCSGTQDPHSLKVMRHTCIHEAGSLHRALSWQVPHLHSGVSVQRLDHQALWPRTRLGGDQTARRQHHPLPTTPPLHPGGPRGNKSGRFTKPAAPWPLVRDKAFRRILKPPPPIHVGGSEGVNTGFIPVIFPPTITEADPSIHLLLALEKVKKRSIHSRNCVLDNDRQIWRQMGPLS